MGHFLAGCRVYDGDVRLRAAVLARLGPRNIQHRVLYACARAQRNAQSQFVQRKVRVACEVPLIITVRTLRWPGRQSQRRQGQQNGEGERIRTSQAYGYELAADHGSLHGLSSLLDAHKRSKRGQDGIPERHL